MKTVLHHHTTYVLRADPGEEVMDALKTFCKQEKITAAHLTIIGAAQLVEVAFYDSERKEYDTITVDSLSEIASAIGNVAVDDEGTIIIHAHGVFGTLDASGTPRTVAGHINKLTVGAACEITLTVFPGTITRRHDEATGLKLMQECHPGPALPSEAPPVDGGEVGIRDPRSFKENGRLL